MEINSDDFEEAIQLFQETEEYCLFCEEWRIRHVSYVYTYFLLYNNRTIVRADTLITNTLY